MFVQGLANKQQTLVNAMSSLAHQTSTSTTQALPLNSPAIKFKEPSVFKGKPEKVNGLLFAIQDDISILTMCFHYR
jgi:hypothetical protein